MPRSLYCSLVDRSDTTGCLLFELNPGASNSDELADDVDGGLFISRITSSGDDIIIPPLRVTLGDGVGEGTTDEF